MNRTKPYILMSIFINIVVWLPLLLQKGIVIQRDFNFPVYPENFLMYHYPTWNYIMSQPTFEQMIRIPMRFPYLFLAEIGVDVPTILKLLIVSTTSFLSVSMFLFLSELRSYYNFKMSNFTILITSLLFAFNPVSLQFLGGISLLFSVGVLPLLLRVSIRYSNAPLKFPILSAFLLLLSLGHPFVFLMNLLIWVIFVLVTDGSFLRSLTKFFGTGLTFLGFSAWYFIPYFSNIVSSISMGRPENLAYSTFKIVSDNNVFKILLLERDRFLYVHTYPRNIVGIFVHFLALGLILIISLLPIFQGDSSKTRRKAHLLFITGYVLSVLFALGEKSIVGGVYYYFISNTPIGWMFRSPLKFQLYEMFFLMVSFAISFDTYIPVVIKQIKRFDNLPISVASIVLLLFILAGSVSYGVWDANYNSFNPIQIPRQFYEINSLLESLNDSYRVLWYPRYNERATLWSKGHYISPFDMKSSRKPTYNTYWNYNYVNTILYDYPYSKMIFSKEYFYTFLQSVGVKYIAFHNDRNVSTDDRLLMNILKRGVPIYSKGGWYLVILNSSYVNEYVFTPTCFAEPGSIDDIYKLASPSRAPVDSTEIPKSLMQRVSIRLEPSGRISNITLPNLVSNPSFEYWENNTLLNWTLLIDPSVTVVSKSCKEPAGDCNLNITTIRSSRKIWDFVVSSPIDVSSHERYLIIVSLNANNISGIHIRVDYYNTTSERWRPFALIPLKYSHEDGWSQYWGIIDVPANVSKIRIVIGSGWTDKGGIGKLLVDKAGVYRIHPCQENLSVDIAYVHTSPTRIDIRANASAPFLLAVNEVYDPGWIAEVYKNGTLIQTVRALRIYGFINGFWIDSDGNLEIVIKYRPQELFNTGLLISLFTCSIIAVVAFLRVMRIRRKNRKGEDST